MSTSFFAMGLNYFELVNVLVFVVLLLNAKKLFIGFARLLGQSVKEFRNASK